MKRSMVLVWTLVAHPVTDTSPADNLFYTVIMATTVGIEQQEGKFPTDDRAETNYDFLPTMTIK